MFRRKRAAELVDRAGRLAASAADAEGHDFETTIGCLVGAVSMYREAGDGEEARRGQAAVARRLANQYVKIGMRDRAAAFAFEYFRALPDRDRDLLVIAYTASLLDIAGHPAQLVEFARRCDRADLPEPLYSVATILSQRARADDFGVEELAGAARMLTHVPVDLRVQCSLFAANALVAKQAAARAVDVLTDLRTSVAVDPIQDARLAQALGAAAARAGDPNLALRMQLLAWGRYSELRYHVGSMRLRRAIDGQVTRLRPGALRAAARASDLRLMLELIESSRLQANVDLPGSLDELDQVLATGEYAKPPGPPDAYVVDSTALPEVYQLTVDDLFEGRADVDGRVDLHVGGVSALAGLAADDGRRGRSRRLDVEAILGRHARADDLWWSSWYDGGALFWSCRGARFPSRAA